MDELFESLQLQPDALNHVCRGPEVTDFDFGQRLKHLMSRSHAIPLTAAQNTVCRFSPEQILGAKIP